MGEPAGQTKTPRRGGPSRPPATQPPQAPEPARLEEQDLLGNATVQAAGRKGRPPRRSGGKLQAGPGRENAPELLDSLRTETLFDLWAIDVDVIFVDARNSYTREWIRGPGNNLIWVAIGNRLDQKALQGKRDDLLAYQAYVEKMSGGFMTRMALGVAIVQRLKRRGGAAERWLSDLERKDLEDLVRVDLGTAFTEFVSAVDHHKVALKAAAKAQAEIFAAVLDILTGFIAPVISQRLANLAGRLPVKPYPNLNYLRVLDLLENKDMTKAILTGVMKATGTTAKVKSATLFGEEEADLFLLWLEREKQTLVHDIAAEMPNMSDDELVVVAARWHHSHANVLEYRAVIGDLLSKFRREVEPIGESVTLGGTSTSWSLHWVEWEGKDRLALLSYVAAPFQFKYFFSSWISPEMEKLARAKAEAGGRRIKKTSWSEIRGKPTK